MIESLNKKEWEDFCLNDLFKITSTSSGIDKCRLINIEGNMPYITRTDKNNGYELYVGIQDAKYKVDGGNVITIGLDTQTVFYQQHLFYTGQNIQILQSSHLNKYTALFIIPMIKILMQKFNWGGNGATLTRLRRSRILLPIVKKGEPDYKFMEEYIKEREAKLKNQYKDYIKSNVNNFKEIKLNKKWKEFFISEIFEKIQRGKRLIKKRQKEGNMPYVSSTALNNGVDNFIGNEIGVRKYENCLSLANSGSVGACFYEPYEFVASDHITHLKGNYSKYAYLFMSCMLNRLSEKYNFNREINDVRIKREKMFLPVNSKNEPDYEFMHNYMLYLEQKKILEYLEYINE